MTQWGLDTIFNPAKRHMDEEKRRLQSTREEVGDNSGGKRIDLESGKVRISPGTDADDHADDADDSAAKNGRTTHTRAPQKEESTGRSGTGKPTPAQIRAAARRGRTLG